MHNSQKTKRLKGVKLKKIQLSFVILASLIILSFAFFVSAQNNSQTQNNIFSDSDQDGLSDGEERIYGTDPHNKDTDNDSYTDAVEVQSGYDPLKPAPGDKLIQENSSGQAASKTETGENLTKKVAYGITQLKQNPDSETSEINISDIQSLVSQALPQAQDLSLGINGTTSEKPLFTVDDIKVKKQGYGDLSAEKAKEKRKEDFVEYSAAILYIFSSNSPQATTSGLNLSSVISSMAQRITTAFSMRDPNQIGDIAESGKKMMEQMKEVTVPEEMVDLHLQGLTFATYAQDMQKYITPNPADPISDMQNLSKVNSLVSNAYSFYTQFQEKSTEYGLLDDTKLINDKLEEYKKNGVGS